MVIEVDDEVEAQRWLRAWQRLRALRPELAMMMLEVVKLMTRDEECDA